VSRDQLQQIGAVLASHVDMVKGFMGDQFAVSIIARHKAGPFHLLLGDDPELTLIACLSELQRIGTALVRDGEAVTESEPTVADHMVELLEECAARFREYEGTHQRRLDNAVAEGRNGAAHAEKAARNRDMAERIEAVLVECPARPSERPPAVDQFTDVRPDPLRHLEPKGCPVCPRCVEPLEPGMTSCPVCGCQVTTKL
jgi:hypothetical protein